MYYEPSTQNISTRRHWTVSSHTSVAPASSDWTHSTYVCILMVKAQVNWQMICLQHCRGQEWPVLIVRCSLPIYRSYTTYQPWAKGLASRNKLVWPQHSTSIPQADTSCAHNGCSSCGGCIFVSSPTRAYAPGKGASLLPHHAPCTDTACC